MWPCSPGAAPTSCGRSTATAPASLGLLGDGTDTTVAVSLPAGTRRVAISDEPAGGSPAPSGLIAGAGTLRPA